MSLDAPNLDSRTFRELMDEARARIPRFAPEWTNFNASDPGMALVQLQAWMTETLLYEFNRVPERNYIKFLDLLGIVPEPARPALTELSFTLDKLDQPSDMLVVSVPLATKVSVDDPKPGQDLMFETDRSLIALNADFGMAVVPVADAAPERALVTGYDKGSSWLHSFDPFMAAPEAGKCLYIGLLLRPTLAKPLALYLTDALPAGRLDLFADAAQVYDLTPAGAEIEGPLGYDCAAAGAAGPKIEWQVYTGSASGARFVDDDDAGWTGVSTSSDGTRGLEVSGHVVLELPKKTAALSPRALDAAFWSSFGQTKPPSTYDELLEVIAEIDILDALGAKWAAMGMAARDVDTIAACGNSVADVTTALNALASVARPDPAKLTAADWEKIDPAFEIALPKAEDEYRPLYWLRARLKSLPSGSRIATLRSFRLNTVSATQAVTRLEDRLGLSNGRPGQMFTLPKLPVLIEPATNAPEIKLAVDGEDWVLVKDFFASGPDDPHYQLDPGTGRITFGDGKRGRIPVAKAPVLVVRYRVGGGAKGNVGAGTITKIKGRVTGVKAVTNLRAAHDGSDAESLDAVKLRAPHELRHRDRAVSVDDFSDLAMRTPGVALHRALALARRAVDLSGNIVERNGSVTLLLLPVNDEERPQPTEAQLEAVCRWLEPRRLITTELHLVGPTYAEVTDLELRIQVEAGHDITAVSDAVYEALLGFLNPITGGVDGIGWVFGDDIYYGDLYKRVLAVEGVRRASGLKLVLEGSTTDTEAQIVPVPEGMLPALSRNRISLVAGYA